MFQPSKYQSAIFSFIETGKGHGVVDAVPGSGKTTTLLESADRLPPGAKAVFLAFNKHIAVEIGEKLLARGSSMTADTIHALGKKTLGNGNLRVEGNKYRQIAKAALLPHMDALTRSQYSFSAVVGKLYEIVKFCMQTLTEPTEASIAALVNHYDLDVDMRDMAWSYIWRGVKPCIAEGVKMYEVAKIISFEDMIFLPVHLNLSCPQFEYVFVDEAQDLNACELELVIRHCTRGRIIAVGDKRQSMYGFAGADTESIPNIIKRLGATVLPLSICYRCAPNITRLAAQVYPGIEACDKADGTIEVIKEDTFILTAKPGDLVLARMNAPLVSQCLRFIANGIRAQVRGKDIGKALSDMVKAMQFRMGFALENLGKLAEEYRREQIASKAHKEDAEIAIAQVNDKVDTFQALLEAYLAQARGQGSIQGFMSYMENFFTDETGQACIMFSTIHKAKGLEYDNVFIIGTDKIPHPAAKKPWQREQEHNIEYVAITRAIKSLRFVGDRIANLHLDEPQEPAQAVLIVEEPAIALPAAAPAVIALPPAQDTPAKAPGAEVHRCADCGRDVDAKAKDCPYCWSSHLVWVDIKALRQAEKKTILSQYLEPTTTCPGCGVVCDTSARACWNCGVVFSIGEQKPVVVVEADPPAPVATPALCVKCHEHPRGKYSVETARFQQGIIPEHDLLCEFCWEKFFMHAANMARAEERKISPSTQKFWKVAWPSFIGIAAPESALVAELCAKCHKRPRGPSMPGATTAHRFPEQQDQLCAECNQELFEQAWALSYSVPGTSWSTPRIFPAAWAAFMDLDVPAATDALCVKCRMQAQMAEGGLIPEQRLLCAGCRIQFYRHVKAMVSQAENVYAFQNSPAQLQAAWPSFIGIAEPEPAQVEVPTPPALPAPAKGMCVSCNQRPALNIVANHPELAVLCGECRADVLTKADQQAQATGWGHYEATVREVLARFLSDRPAPVSAVADEDAPDAQPREKQPKKERTKDYHTALDGSKQRCQITMPTEDLETLKAMGLNPAEVFHELLHRWPPFLEALAAQQKVSA